MSYLYRTVLLENETFERQARDKNSRLQFQDTLNSFGQNGWEAYHLEQQGNDMLIYLKQKMN